MNPSRHAGGRIRPDLLARPAGRTWPVARPAGTTETIYCQHVWSPPAAGIFTLHNGLVARWSGRFRDVPINAIEDVTANLPRYRVSLGKLAHNRLYEQHTAGTVLRFANGWVTVGGGPQGYGYEHAEYDAMVFAPETAPAGRYAGQRVTVGRARARLIRVVETSGREAGDQLTRPVLLCGGGNVDLPAAPDGYWYPSWLNPAAPGEFPPIRVDSLVMVTYVVIFPALVAAPVLTRLVELRGELDVLAHVETDLPGETLGGPYRGTYLVNASERNTPLGEAAVTTSRVDAGYYLMTLARFGEDPNDDVQQPVRGGRMLTFVGAQLLARQERYSVDTSAVCSILPGEDFGPVPAFLLNLRHLP